jgi:hypothetical protein
MDRNQRSVRRVYDVCKSKSGNLKMDAGGEFMYGHDEEKEEPFVVRELKAKADLFLERNRIYGDNYKRFGAIFSMIMQGQNLDTSNPSDMCRLGILVQIVGKVTRYGENFNRGGHDDSLDDIAVYSLMLKELDGNASGAEEENPFKTLKDDILTEEDKGKLRGDLECLVKAFGRL